MKIAEFDTVALTEPVEVPSEEGDGTVRLEAGTEGAVVMIYGDHDAYEVEFMEGGDSPYTIALATLKPEQVRLVQKHRPVATYAAD